MFLHVNIDPSESLSIQALSSLYPSLFVPIALKAPIQALKIVSVHLVVSGNKETRDLIRKTSTRLTETRVSVQSHKPGCIETRVWIKSHANRSVPFICVDRQPQPQVSPNSRFGSKPLKQVNENVRFHLPRQPT